MSNALLYQSLELIDSPNSVKKGSKKGAIKKHSGPKRKELKKSGLSKYSQSLKVTTLDEIRKQLDIEKHSVDKTIEKLMLFSKISSVDSNVAQKLFNRAAKKQPTVEDKKVIEEEEGTVFTEEDFINFERDYVEQ